MQRKPIFAVLAAVALGTFGAAAHAQYAPRQDLDRDGIQNRYDRDRDGDGLANANDPQPSVYNRVQRHAPMDRFGPMGDLDRDGIQNRHDRDRDGDGVRNARDRYPNDRRYS
jgi:hypothetical protein